MNSIIEVSGLHKSYGSHHVLKGIDLSVNKSEVIAIIGPSGSGKSSFIRCLNGLEKFQKGEVSICGHKISPQNFDSEITKKVGMVFQSFNLFPHMSVLENICLAQKLVRKRTVKEAKNNAFELLKRVGLELHAYKLPADLSGGQQQRVAIARALALDPEVMLFDEATSALDPEITHEVLSVMKDLASSGMTMIVVTHEMAFAKKVADQILFFDEGVVVEQEKPQIFFEQPRSDRARIFLSQIR